MRLSVIALLLIASSALLADDKECGPDYPDNVPCLSGVLGVFVGTPFPNAKAFALMYEKPLEEVYDEFTHAASDAGWEVAERDVNRSYLRKGGVTVAFVVVPVSAWPSSAPTAATQKGRSILQVTVFSNDAQ
jgi:hypothetical protein